MGLSIFWPKKSTFKAKMYIFPSFYCRPKLCTESLILYLFCPWKIKKTSRILYQNCQICPKHKGIRFIRVLKVLGIYNFDPTLNEFPHAVCTLICCSLHKLLFQMTPLDCLRLFLGVLIPFNNILWPLCLLYL